jgi:hypothetical protein
MQTPEPCLCGADDCKRCFPFNRQSCEITDNDRADACDAIVEEVLDYGSYPKHSKPQVDLYEFVADNLDTSYAFELVVAALSTNKQALEIRIERLHDMVEAMLKKDIADTDMLEELAQEMADDRGQI